MAIVSPSGGEDPGWRYALRGAWLFLVPFPGRLLLGRRLRRAAHSPVTPLELTRLLYLNFVGALIMVGVVVGILAKTSSLSGSHTVDAAPAAGVLVVIGLGSIAGPRRLEAALDCSDDAHLIDAYRTRFFLRVAFAETAALFGFVGFIVTGGWWMYPLGLVFAAVGFYRLAPTASNLAHDQAALDMAGCRRSLLRALTVVRRLPRGQDERGPGPA